MFGLDAIDVAGNQVVAISNGGKVLIANQSDFSLSTQFDAKAGDTSWVAFEDENHLVTSSDSGGFEMWDRNGRRIESFSSYPVFRASLGKKTDCWSGIQKNGKVSGLVFTRNHR
ncbi:MAG: hypothetical protein KDB03_12965 [Planctomycetales bacterium]|nr:hypothetical protein [Planctomycetales bacterium]